MRRYSPKVVFDLLHGVIDISPVLPVVETREFQALADKRQLGMTYLTFRSAKHSRFDHCLGAYRATRTLGHKWVHRGYITATERDALAVYALVHDVGHPAFSHVTEDFCALDDDERTLELIDGPLRSAIEACDVDADLVHRLATRRESPLYLAVHDKNLGMEKLDYLERDGLFTGIGRPPGIRYLRDYIEFVDQRICVDEKMVDHVTDVMAFYMEMYKHVYFRKSLVIAQRMFHRAVRSLIVAGELNPVELYDMTDTELLARMMGSRESLVSWTYRLLRERQLFREAVVVRSEALVNETRVSGKSIRVLGVPPERMQQLIEAPVLDKKNHEQLQALEKAIARATNIPLDLVLVVPVFNPERFSAKDVAILGSNGELHSLKERRPAHFQKMEETARSYTALRVCSTPEYRQRLSNAAGTVLQVIQGML